MGRPRRCFVEPIIAGLLEGKVPKQIGAELGVAVQSVNETLRQFRRDSGCKTLLQAVVKYVKAV